MIRRGASGHITNVGSESGPITCKACLKIIISSVNLINGEKCPFCHHNIHEALPSDDIIKDDSEILVEDSEDIAQPC